jgi:hypothetical protein
MRMSCLNTRLNPMTDIANPAKPAQSPTFSFVGFSVVIIEKGRATFTLFLPLRDLFLSLRDTTLCAGRDLRARVLSSAIPQPSHQLGGWYSDLHMHARLVQVDAATGPQTPVATCRVDRPVPGRLVAAVRRRKRSL